MWTPKRVLLLLGGTMLFGAVYVIYARFLGWLDGLPQIPAERLLRSPGGFTPPPRAISPTVQRLQEAFGPDCLEQQSVFYQTQLEFRSGESSIVLASGTPPFNNGSNHVVLTPFSLAVFGKPTPDRQPGEAVPISTFHADKAVLEFDRPVNGPGDMMGDKAKLLRMELVSEPELNPTDPRRGTVYVTNNQRSPDPNKHLVLRTPGPVFYRDPKFVDPKAAPGGAAGPDIWTDAPVEIVDRQNLPRAYGAPAPPTASARGTDLRSTQAVAEILSGHHAPPPTVTGVGLRLYLEPDDKQAASAPPAKGAGRVGGLRRVELVEKVVVNLWVDARQTFVTPAADDARNPAPDGPPAGKAGHPLAPPEPPAATAAIVGGVFFAAQNARQLDRALLQIDTLGPFSYDAEKSVARFEVLPGTHPNRPNDVQVHRVPPRGGAQRLFSEFLEIEFNDSPTASSPPDPARPPAAARPTQARPNEVAGPSFKRLHAWTESKNRVLTVSSDDDRLEAFCQDLVRDQTVNQTTLSVPGKGDPLRAIRSNPPRADGKPAGGNVLTAGEKQPAVLILKPGDGPDKAVTATVEGPGRIDLLDEVNANTTGASWQTRFTHVKERVDKRELDLLTFTDGAKFEDKKADFWLKGKVLKLWLESGKKPDPGLASDRGGPLPYRVQAVDDVSTHSPDFFIEEEFPAQHLNILFQDIPPPEPKPAPAAPPPVTTRPNPNPTPPPAIGPAAKAPEPVQEEPKPKPPMKLRARKIDTLMTRYPLKEADPKKPVGPPSAKPGGKPVGDKPVGDKPLGDKPLGPGEGSMKYEMKWAWCEGNVFVHQDSAEPAPDKRGVDIHGRTLHIDNTPDGSVLTVTGIDDQRPGQVHHEGMSIIGPKVVIDQLQNTIVVDGRGAMVMPAGTDLNGTELKQPSVVVVHWRDGMNFQGATKLAEFVGKVTAQQNQSSLYCHTLHVQLDRPVDFSQRRKPVPPRDPKPDPRGGKSAKDKDDPKIKSVHCYPAPDDATDEPKGARFVTYSEVTRDEAGNLKSQHLTARELVLTAQVFEAGIKDPYQQVIAYGPGTVRIWQLGQKDAAGPPAGNAPPPGAPPKPADTEMKLTIIQFGRQMTARDWGPIYQDATFLDTIDVINAPADRADAVIDPHRLPPGSARLTCADKLIVSTHKRQNAPTAQRMDAFGNAYIRSDEYDGWGETVTSDGPTVTLKGGENTLARIVNRYNRTENPGKTIIYDRITGGFRVEGSAGATIQGSPAQSAPKQSQPMPGSPQPSPGRPRPGPYQPQPSPSLPR
ncbi:MAG: hypothetical protein JWO38_2901 [Gemmataceae bacterium]|nr:hypothetical protein [Gemmataceae bacterium]